MNEDDFFARLNEDSIHVLKQIAELNPNGSMILNDHLEIVRTNQRVREYFEGDQAEAERYFGNAFRCEYVTGETTLCGIKKECANCKIRNSMLNALNLKCVVRHVQVHKAFVLNGKKKVKWFDLTISPIEMRGKTFLWLSLFDLTELMAHKLELEVQEAFEEEDILEKERFHEAAITKIEQSDVTEGVYIILSELHVLKTIQERFGALWRNDYLEAYRSFLAEVLEEGDLFYRSSGNRFLIVSTASTSEKIKEKLSMIEAYQYSYFNNNHVIANRTIHLKISDETREWFKEGNALPVLYFRALSFLEQLEEGALTELKL
jgi:GGDEF domain-containing protein